MATRNNTRKFKIAVIPGDGIGKEVVPEGLRTLEAASAKFGMTFSLDGFDFASCDYCLRHGKMMPDNWKELIGSHDAIFFGAVGWPATVPDHISLWGSLLQFRREFDQYVNLRPVRLMPGVPSPLAGRKPGDIDFYVVRENTEGEYSSIGGKMFPDTDREIVMQETVMSRIGVDRILKFAFELAKSRPKKHLTSATKSNGLVEVALPNGGKAKAPTLPITLDGRRLRFQSDPPEVGADTSDLLRDIGMDDAAIEQLIADGVAACDVVESRKSPATAELTT